MYFSLNTLVTIKSHINRKTVHQPLPFPEFLLLPLSINALVISSDRATEPLWSSELLSCHLMHSLIPRYLQQPSFLLLSHSFLHPCLHWAVLLWSFANVFVSKPGYLRTDTQILPVPRRLFTYPVGRCLKGCFFYTLSISYFSPTLPL